MTDNLKKLKQNEQEKLVWDDDLESAEVLKPDDVNDGLLGNIDRQTLARVLFAALVLGIIVFWVVNGVGATSALIDRFGWIFFLVPLFVVRWLRRG